MKGFALSEAADRDLKEIWLYISQDSVNAADAWIARLYGAFDLVARNPGVGRSRPMLTSSQVLFWPIDAYVVIYKKTATKVFIVAVTQGARDIPTLLKRRRV